MENVCAGQPGGKDTELSCALHIIYMYKFMVTCGHLISPTLPGLVEAEVDPTTAIDLILDTGASAPCAPARCHSSVAMFPLELAIMAAQRWTERRSALVTVVSPAGAALSSGISPEMLRFSGDVSIFP